MIITLATFLVYAKWSIALGRAAAKEHSLTKTVAAIGNKQPFNSSLRQMVITPTAKRKAPGGHNSGAGDH